MKQGAFAAARRPDDADKFAFFDLQIDVREHVSGPLPASITIRLVDVR
jgi:hypothetical protein